MKLHLALIATLACGLPLVSSAQESASSGGWIQMFNGKNLDGWKANQSPESWSAVDGMIKGDGDVSHLFWLAQQCGNCEFKAEVKIGDKGNSGMYFRAEFGPGWPKGYEAQVNATHGDPVKTGSLYNFQKNFTDPTGPDVWFTQHIIANGNHIIIKVNGKVISDYVDEKNTHMQGLLALQQHNKGSVVYFKNLMFRPLPEKQ